MIDLGKEKNVIAITQSRAYIEIIPQHKHALLSCQLSQSILNVLSQIILSKFLYFFL